MNEQKVILSIRGMSKSFGRNRVLEGINFDLKKGTIMGLMGENGAGKSTMMKCLFGSYQKDLGEIYLDGKEVNFSGPKDALENGIPSTSHIACPLVNSATRYWSSSMGKLCKKAPTRSYWRIKQVCTRNFGKLRPSIINSQSSITGPHFDLNQSS